MRCRLTVDSLTRAPKFAQVLMGLDISVRRKSNVSSKLPQFATTPSCRTCRSHVKKFLSPVCGSVCGKIIAQ